MQCWFLWGGQTIFHGFLPFFRLLQVSFAPDDHFQDLTNIAKECARGGHTAPLRNKHLSIINALGSPYEGSPPEIKSFLCPSMTWSFSKALEALGTWTSDTIAPASATAMSRKRSSSLAQQAWLLPAAVMRVGWFVSLYVGYSLRPFAAPDGIPQRAGLSVEGS